MKKEEKKGMLVMKIQSVGTIEYHQKHAITFSLVQISVRIY